MSTTCFLLFCIFGVLQNVIHADNWAVLIAGSNYFFNYRHQADVMHSYQILTQKGKIPKSNIILMAFDDIARNRQNPFPDQIFNHPNGTDVYKGAEISYSGHSVNKTTFLKVLRGDTTAGGRVLKSTASDDVFIYYSDHGAAGLVAMPSGDMLYADELKDALEFMHKNNMYRQLVFYLEACESGSMFDGILPDNISVYATTASNPTESSYAFYWNDTIGVYLGDEYSVRWMEDSDTKWNIGESLKQQFQTVKRLVNKSHVEMYGTTSWISEQISDFQGDHVPDMKLSVNIPQYPSSYAVDSRDVKLVTLMRRYLKSSSPKDYIVMRKEIIHRNYADRCFNAFAAKVTGYTKNSQITDFMMSYATPPRNFKCLRGIVSTYERFCGKFTSYSLKYVRTLVNACERYNYSIIRESVVHICGVTKKVMA